MIYLLYLITARKLSAFQFYGPLLPEGFLNHTFFEIVPDPVANDEEKFYP